jgi:hypothetical protein
MRLRNLFLILVGAALIALEAFLGFNPWGRVGEAPTAQQAATRPPVREAKPAISTDRLADAGRAVFGAADGATISVASGTDYGAGGSIDEQVAYTPKYLIDTDFGPVLLSEGAVVDSAHVSAGKIAADYLKPHGAGFAVAHRYPKAVVTGSFGQVGQWSASDAYLPEWVIVAEGGGTWQGYSCSWGVITMLTAQGPKEVASFPLSYSNGGAIEDGEKETAIEGKLTNIVKGRGFDIAYSGSRSFTEHYRFAEGKFVLQSGTSKMEQC